MAIDLGRILLDEKRFPYEGMSLDERNYYFNIISNCKDICNTENRVNDENKCRIIELHFKKNNSVINVNGSVNIGNENRCINADIFINKNSIVVDMLVTRLCVDDKLKEYSVLDEFKLEKGVLKRRSQYNYNMTSIFENIENEEMKGRLK